jgi:hypothetical protein
MKAISFIFLLVCLGCGKERLPEWEYQQAEWSKDFSSVRLHIGTAKVSPDDPPMPLMSAAELLEVMGKRGWELVSVQSTNGTDHFYFKRPRRSALEVYLFEPHYKADDGAK